jgi:hypothetical protein
MELHPDIDKQKIKMLKKFLITTPLK